METNYSRPAGLPERTPSVLQSSDILRGLGRTDATRLTQPQQTGDVRQGFGGGVPLRTTLPEANTKRETPEGPTIYQMSSGTDGGDDDEGGSLREQSVISNRRIKANPPPNFDGRQARHWLSRAGRYYYARDFTEEEKLWDAVNRLEGKALDYWCAVEHGDPESLPVDWDGFKTFMLERFSERTVGDTIKRLQQIEYKGSVDDVADEFAEVLTEGQSPPREFLKDQFLSIFPFYLVESVMKEKPETWVKARELLRKKLGTDQENALKWYSLASDKRRKELADRPEYSRTGWIPLRGFRQEHQECNDIRRDVRNCGVVKPVTRQDYSSRKNSLPEGRMLSNRQEVMKCYACGGEGHRARACPNGILSAKKEGQRCRRCGGMGHWATACPTQNNYRQNINREPNARGIKDEAFSPRRQGNGQA